jgi:hypothetical protein
MTDKLYRQSFVDVKDFYGNLETLYSGTVLELKRQITQHTKEGGQFL